MVFIFILAFIIILLDQLTKLFVVGFFIDPQVQLFSGMLSFEGDSVTLIDKVFSFTYVLNEGAAFGILQNQRLFFLIVTIIVCTAGIIMLLRLPIKHITLKLSSAFILGGAIGNLIDRVVIGVVRDFLDATFVDTITGYSFPVFNVADIFVVVGVCLLAVYILFIHDKVYPPKKKQDSQK